MKKKSLDDYLMIIRLVILLKFPFEKNFNKKFGELRNYVKASKKPFDKWVKDNNNDIEKLYERLNQ